MILREAKQVYVPSIHLEEILEKIDRMDRDKKINSIRTIRDTYHLGLKDSKDLVEQGWAFLDFMKKLNFPITTEEFTIQSAYGEVNYGNDPSNYGVYEDEQSFNQHAYENDSHDDLPW